MKNCWLTLSSLNSLDWFINVREQNVVVSIIHNVFSSYMIYMFGWYIIMVSSFWHCVPWNHTALCSLVKTLISSIANTKYVLLENLYAFVYGRQLPSMIIYRTSLTINIVNIHVMTRSVGIQLWRLHIMLNEPNINNWRVS